MSRLIVKGTLQKAGTLSGLDSFGVALRVGVAFRTDGEGISTGTGIVSLVGQPDDVAELDGIRTRTEAVGPWIHNINAKVFQPALSWRTGHVAGKLDGLSTDRVAGVKLGK